MINRKRKFIEKSYGQSNNVQAKWMILTKRVIIMERVIVQTSNGKSNGTNILMVIKRVIAQRKNRMININAKRKTQK